MRGLIAHAAAVFGVAAGDIAGRGRKRRIVRVRQAVAWVARQATGHSFPAIGRWLGGRDHSTVIHGCRQVDIFMARDREFAWTVERLWAAGECAPLGPRGSARPSCEEDHPLTSVERRPRELQARGVRRPKPENIKPEAERWREPPARPGEYRARHALPLTPDMIDPDNAGFRTVRAGFSIGGAA